jgi:hypothetical protein
MANKGFSKNAFLGGITSGLQTKYIKNIYSEGGTISITGVSGAVNVPNVSAATLLEVNGESITSVLSSLDSRISNLENQ